MVSVMVVIFLIIIAIFLYVRFTVHFSTCRKVSEKYPGEKIQGCPVWTLVDDNSNKKANKENMDCKTINPEEDGDPEENKHSEEG